MTTWKLPDKPILPDAYHVAAGDRELDREAVVTLIAELFTEGKHLESIRQVFLGSPCYDWNTMRLVWDGDQLIHHWGVIGYQMRLASIHLKVAGVGAVGTREEYRKRGVMTSAALSSLEVMRTNGYDLSILRGRHYVKFGYARAWNHLTVRLKSQDLPIMPSSGEYRPLSLVDQNKIDSLYNRFHSHFTGTAVRPIYHEILDGELKVHGWFDSSGELTGYVRTIIDTEKNELTCQEAAGDPERCLAVLTELANESGCNSLAFFTLPYDHPILQLVRRGACLVEEQYFHNTGWRVRVVNLMSCLRKMQPLLEFALQNSHLLAWRGQLILDGGDQAAVLEIDNGSVRVLLEDIVCENKVLAGWSLGRLLIGSDEPLEVIRQEGIQCTGLGLELARVLFPNRHPMLSQWDEF